MHSYLPAMEVPMNETIKNKEKSNKNKKKLMWCLGFNSGTPLIDRLKEIEELFIEMQKQENKKRNTKSLGAISSRCSCVQK